MHVLIALAECSNIPKMNFSSTPDPAFIQRLYGVKGNVAVQFSENIYRKKMYSKSYEIKCFWLTSRFTFAPLCMVYTFC